MTSIRRALAAALLSLPLAAAGAETVTVAIWGSSPAEVVAFDQAAAAFTRSTGIVVKKQVIEDKYMDVLKSRFAARNPPDVVSLDASEAPVLIQSGVLASFDDPPAALADFYPHFLDAFRGADGKLYGLPRDYSTLALYLNPALIRGAGFKLEQVPADFDGLMRFARALQARLPKGVAAMTIEKDLARHLSALETAGPPIIRPDGSVDFMNNRPAYDYLQQLVTGHAARYLHSPKDDLGADWPGAAFGAQKSAMMMEGNWVLSALKAEYADVRFATREMPTVNGKRQTMAFVVGYSVPRGARNPRAGIRFVRFMTGEGMRLWASRSGTLPTRKSVEAAMGVRALPELAVHVQGATYARVWAGGPSLPILNTNFGIQFLAAFNGTKPLAQALYKAETVSNREIERQR